MKTPYFVALGYTLFTVATGALVWVHAGPPPWWAILAFVVVNAAAWSASYLISRE